MPGPGARVSANSPRSSVPRRLLGVGLISLAVGAGFAPVEPGRNAVAAPPRAEAQPERPTKFLTLSSPIDATVAGLVQTETLALQAKANRTGGEALLVLEIPQGSSSFGSVRDLAQFLTSGQLSRVQTVAWVPASVNGNNVVVALACNDIVMHPEATLGDIGRGQAVPPADAAFITNLVEKGHNPKVNAALAQGMINPNIHVLRATIGQGRDAATKVVTAEQLKKLQAGMNKAVQTTTIKQEGVVGAFAGARARRFGFLVTATARDQRELAVLYDLQPGALRPDPSMGEPPRVAYIKIEGVIDPMTETFVQRQIHRELVDGANLIIFKINSPGGRLSSSENLAYYIADLDPKKVRTVAYVPEEAHSGAAMIALGCDEIYMGPQAQLGDAAPIEARKGGAFARVPEKILSAVRLTLRNLGEHNGRPGALCEAMADKSLRVYQVTNRKTGRIWYMSEAEIHQAAGDWIKGPLVPESREGNLLTVDGRRAHELKLAGAPVASLAELKQRVGIPAEMKLHPVGRTWVDSLIFFLNRPVVAGALITLGILLIYLELHFMTGIMAILSVLCFALFFWSKYLGGTAGWLEVILFAVGIACIGLEMFVVPGFGVFGASGGLLIIFAFILASQTFDSVMPGRDFQELTQTVGMLSGATIATLIFAIILSHYLPRIPMLGQMVLAPPGAELDDGGPHLMPAEEAPSLVGQRGRTTGPLRPVGKAEIGGEYMDVFSNGGFIEGNREVEVVRQEGNRIFVRGV